MSQSGCRTNPPYVKDSPHYSTYVTWCAMRQRCYDKKKHNYKWYGGRGITVCKRWNSFNNFLADMGVRPIGHTLDRVKKNGNYCKSNCKWSTQKEQTNNTRSNRLITYNGETLTASQWSEKTGIKSRKIRQRIDRDGWSLQKALTK